uniref:Uncharacterized protein n=1 Tax=Panagrolaimus superbus TaxID=310955 RepID=A0A914YSJ3_9BILA
MPFMNAAKIPFIWTNQDTGNAIIASVLPVGIGTSIIFSAAEDGNLTEYFRQSRKPSWGTANSGVHAACAFATLSPLGYASYRIFKNTAGAMTDKSQLALALYGSCMAVSILSGYFNLRKNYQMDAYTKLGIAGSAIAFALAFREVDSTAFLYSVPFVGWSIFSGLYHYNLYKLNAGKQD